MNLSLGFGLDKYRVQNATLLNQIPAANLATMWLDGTIVDVSGSKYFVNKKGDNVLITGYDFPAGWVKGFPYKSAATIDIFGQTGVPVVSLFQNFDYADKYFCRHVAQVLDGNDVETSEAYVSEIVAYSEALTGDDLTEANTYYVVPAQEANARWVSKSGNDTTGNGTKGNPYLTITKGRSGTYKTYVLSGSYTENGVYNNLAFDGNYNIKAVGCCEIKQTNSDYVIFLLNTGTAYLSNFIINAENKKNCARVFGNSGLHQLDRCLFKNASENIIKSESISTTAQIIKNSIFINNNNISSVSLGNPYSLISCLFLGKTTSGNIYSVSILASGIITVKYCKSITNNTAGAGVVQLGTVLLSDVNIFNNEFICSTGNCINISTQKSISVKYNKLTANTTPLAIAHLSATALTVCDVMYNTLINTYTSGYCVSIGNENASAYDNKITSINVIGNKCFGRLKYNYTDTDINNTTTHGIFAGHNINAVIKYNFVEGCRIGIINKHTSGANVSGGTFYNIIKDCIEAIYIKGQDDVKIYGNTVYNNIITAATQGFKALRIGANGGTNYSTGCDIQNNIFVNTLANKNICGLLYADEAESTFTSDYNTLYAVDRIARIAATDYADLTALRVTGNDVNSNSNNPNLSSLLVPSAQITGASLDAAYDDGLDTSTDFGSSTLTPVIVTKQQAATWQQGAYIQ